MENIVELCRSHHLLTDDTLAIISFAPSEYLKNHILSGCLQYLKLPEWLKICDVLHDAELTKHLGAQIKYSKLQKMCIHILVILWMVHMCMYNKGLLCAEITEIFRYLY